MSLKALATGSALIPADINVLRLYSMRFCPYAQRTRLVLEHKEIPHEVVNVNLKHKPEWLVDKNPHQLVPVIEFKGQAIYESLICDDYLEECFPEPKLTPASVVEKFRQKLLMHDFDKALPYFLKLLSSHQEKKEQAIEVMTSLLHRLEADLSKSHNTFFGGVNVALVDFHLWPWFERFPAIHDLTGLDMLSLREFPSLAKWVTSMSEVKAVQRTKFSRELHQQFLVSMAMKDPQYDLGLGVTSNL